MKNILFLQIILAVVSAGLVAQEESPTNESQAIAFCLEGVKEQCASLRSGRATITGSLTSSFELKPEYNLDGPVEGLVAYDGTKVRFDITRPGWVVDQEILPTLELGDPAKMVKGKITKRFSCDGLRVTIWNSDQPMIMIAQESDMPDWKTTEHIDFRCPTLFDRYSIGQGWSLEEILERFKTEFPKDCSCVKQDGIWELTWTYRDERDTTRWLLTVDTKRGFVPTKYKCETKFAVFPEKWITEWENRTEWAQCSNVWVPIRSERLIYNTPASNLDEALAMDLTWDSINQSLESDLFSYKGFDVPDEIAVQDSSSGEAVWIKPFAMLENADLESFGTARTSWKQSRLVWFGVLCVGSLLTYAMYKVRRRRHS